MPYPLDVNQLVAKLEQHSLSTEDDSSNDFHVDSDEILLDADADAEADADTEKDDVAIITPESDIDIDLPAPIRADDCMPPLLLDHSERS